MDTILEVIIELLLDVAIDEGVDAIHSKKTPKRGRLAIAIVALLLCFAIIIGVTLFGVTVWDKNPLVAVLLILTGVGLLFAFLKHFVVALIIKLVKMAKESK